MLNPSDVPLIDICSPDVVTVQPSATLEDAVVLMQKHSLRRLLVVEEGRAVGVLTLGDLAIDRDPQSVLGSISTATPSY